MLDVSGFLINIIACAMQGHFRSRQRLPSESEIDERIIPAGNERCSAENQRNQHKCRIGIAAPRSVFDFL